MKTPREILLASHQAADAKLDKIRRTAISDLGNGATKDQSSVAWFLDCAQHLWRELVLPKPQAWAAVAALWVVILALKLSTHDGAPVLANKTSLTPQVVAELKQQKAFFGELAGLPPSPAANPPKAVPSRPRSAREPEFSRA